MAGPLNEACKKANRQIKQTKDYFGLHQAGGVLIIANIGNTGLIPSLALFVLANLIHDQYSGIDAIIYFTPNIHYSHFLSKTHIDIWFGSVIRPNIEKRKLESIREKWFKYRREVLGHTFDDIGNPDPRILDGLRPLDNIR
jgi:hypothetical protein